EFHMGQQAAACANGPDISVLPYLSSNMPNSLQSGRRPHKRLLFCAFLRGLSSAPGELTENRTETVFEILKKGFGPTAPSAVIAG
ncbi:hypothetical protein, partial [Ralstonia solanacearum]|uniref:hypothetical protein n=1 Tax=Ralstonia solanacearum TaxID=305 RepID=UPI001E29C1CC